ncbi:MAG: ribosome silencing factor, partial [Pleurocapsa sp. SU_196_0]|nr:ribosome silencing factor [Pleurocapsa sp. SU_196_0]
AGSRKSVLENCIARGYGRTMWRDFRGGRWVLLDFVDFVVHLFHPESRSFYQLERLWSDAPEITPGA